MNNTAHCPIFVMGSARSGTTLLASLVASASQVAEYRAETIIMQGCERKYGSLAKPGSKQRFARDWFGSRQSNRLNLPPETLQALLDRATSYAELVKLTMDELATQQGKTHWLDSTPANVYALADISQVFPNAKVIHIVRDGRAVSASLRKLGWTAVRSKTEIGKLQYAALKWQASLHAFNTSKHLIPEGTFEISYESLISEPRKSLAALCEYLGFDEGALDESLLVGDGSKPAASENKIASNSAFGSLSGGLSHEPMVRWKKQLEPVEIAAIECVVAKTLVEKGYELVGGANATVALQVSGLLRKSLFLSKAAVKRSLPLRWLYSTPIEVGLD